MKVSDIEGSLAEKPEVIPLGKLLARAVGPERAGWTDLPSCPGVYAVSFPSWETRPFTADAGQARHAAVTDTRTLIDKRDRILAGGPTDILYIGKADNLR